MLLVRSGGGGEDTCRRGGTAGRGTGVWTACAPSLEDLGLADVDVPLGGDCLPLLEEDSGHVAGCGEEGRDDLFGSAPRSLEFPRWAFTWEKPDSESCWY